MPGPGGKELRGLYGDSPTEEGGKVRVLQIDGLKLKEEREKETC